MIEAKLIGIVRNVILTLQKHELTALAAAVQADLEEAVNVAATARVLRVIKIIVMSAAISYPVSVIFGLGYFLAWACVLVVTMYFREVR